MQRQSCTPSLATWGVSRCILMFRHGSKEAGYLQDWMVKNLIAAIESSCHVGTSEAAQSILCNTRNDLLTSLLRR